MQLRYLYWPTGTGHRARIGRISSVPAVRSLPQVPRRSAGFPGSREISNNSGRIRKIRQVYRENALSGSLARTGSRREPARDPPTPRQIARTRGPCIPAQVSGPIPGRIAHPAALCFPSRIPAAILTYHKSRTYTAPGITQQLRAAAGITARAW